jgi:hypothetical protein
MKKISLAMMLSLVLVFGLALNAMAFNVVYTGTDTNYAVTSVSGNDVKEDYNAQSLIPFTSHDGNAVVDLDSTGSPIYFDKVMVFNDKNDLKKNFEITWDITNTTPYTWSDYHFILANEGQSITKAQSADFKGVTITDPTLITFFYDPPGGQLIDPGDTLHVNFTLDTSALSLGDDIELRQIATAVPLPAALPLFGTGLLGLGLLGWRRK